MRDSRQPVVSLRERLDSYRSARSVPSPAELDGVLAEANGILAGEDRVLRPRDRFGEPGGVVELIKELPTVLLPDIHARPGLIWAALNYRSPGSQSVLEALLGGHLQLVCLGDYFHGEARVRQRWRRALAEFADGFRSHKAMDEEMAESLAVLLMVASLKAALPTRVHLLKGNHENIRNESKEGNHPFGKFAYEGAMVLEYMRLRYTDAQIDRLYEFEKRLPLVAVGRHFLITHAEPARFYSRAEVIDYRSREEVVEGLTWTDNDRAERNAVDQMLAHYLSGVEAPTALHFGGHRPVRGRYHLRARGRYVQIHNPSRYIMALLVPNRPVDLARDVLDIGAPEDAIDGPSA